MRNALLALAILTGCATATAPTTAPATAAPPAQTAAAPCNAGHQLLNAVLWVNGAEYRAAALQTYAAARRQLDVALADRSFIGAEEETANDPSQPPAVILDLDETTLDNAEFEAQMIRAGTNYDATKWNSWVASAEADAVPGSKEFLAYAHSRGVTPFYITNRDFDPEGPGTRLNLERLGVPLTADNLLMRGQRPEWKSDKAGRRAHVAASYRVLLVIGDDLNDFTNAREKSHAEREAIIARTESWWGTRWFMVPNPMYGSWERAAIGTDGSPCEQIQRKIDALR